jgi:hypothetical protein
VQDHDGNAALPQPLGRSIRIQTPSAVRCPRGDVKHFCFFAERLSTSVLRYRRGRAAANQSIDHPSLLTDDSIRPLNGHIGRPAGSH